MKTLASFAVLACALVCCAYAEGLALDWVQLNVTGNKPEPRYHHGAAAIVGNNTDLIVIVGGFDFEDNGEFLNDTWLFHTRNNTWRYVNSSESTNLTIRAYLSANTYRYEVVVFGGQGPNGTVYNDVWRFREWRWHQDTYINTTTNETKILLNRYNHASAIIGDILYVFGGHSGFWGVTTNELFAYNLTSRNWTILNNFTSSTSAPQGRQGHTLHAYKDPTYGDSLILFGGYFDRPDTAGFNDAWQYVISQNKWNQLSSAGAPPGRTGHSAAFIQNTLYIQGGYTIQPPPTYDVYWGDTWALTLNGGGASKWVQITSDSPFGIGRRQGHVTVSVNNTLYSIGGYQQYIGLDNKVWTFLDK